MKNRLSLYTLLIILILCLMAAGSVAAIFHRQPGIDQTAWKAIISSAPKVLLRNITQLTSIFITEIK
jgi:hypothetical protein